MLIQFNNYLIPYFFIIPVTLALIIFLLRLKSGEDSRFTSFMFIACLIWASGYTLEIMNTTLAGKIIFSGIKYFGVVSVVVLIFILSAKLAGFTRLLKKDMLIILSIIPAAGLALFITNYFHGLMMRNMVVHQDGMLIVASLDDYGIAYWIYLGYISILSLAALVFLFLIITGRHRFFRRQAAILIFSLVTVYTLESFYMLRVISLPVDLAPLAACICFILYWIFGYRYLKMGEVVPINYESIIENINDCVMVLNRKDMVTFYNRPTQDIFSSESNIMGKPVSSFWPGYNIDFARENPEARKDVLISSGQGKRYFDVTVSSIKRDNTETTGKLIILKDITERKKYEDKIKYMSFHDYLTGLYNRAFFEEELKRLDSKRNLPLSVVLGDVNGLKIINDSYGHEKGDELLIKLAEILRQSFRKSDIISRWGGDEFIILLPLTKYLQAEKMVKRIEDACRRHSSDDMTLSISLGISTKEREDEDIEEIIKTAEDRMYKNKMNDEKRVHRTMISSLEKTLEEKDYETEEQVKRMEELSLQIGKTMKLSEIELNELVMLSALHDIGKIAVADSIILKPGKLTSEEWELVKKHPEVGYRIAKSSVDLAAIADAILAHHENWDGSGYPEGVKGSQIPLLSRIISIVDSYAAMTSDRPYRKAMTKEEAVSEIRKSSGVKYDPKLVKVFLEIVEK